MPYVLHLPDVGHLLTSSLKRTGQYVALVSDADADTFHDPISPSNAQLPSMRAVAVTPASTQSFSVP